MNGRRKRVGLLVDHPRRDLDGMTLVAYQLARLGAEAVLLPMYTSGVDIPLARLDAVVVNYARQNNVEMIEALARSGIAVFVLDTEGYLSSERHRPLIEAVRDCDAAPWISGYAVWGQAARDTIAEIEPRLADKLVVTGCPRFDFLAPQWRGMLTFEESGYVLLNANFNCINPRFVTPAQERANMIEGGWEPEYLDGFLTDMRSAFAGFRALAGQLARALPEHRFLLRPHPFERTEPYAEAVAGLPNVSLNLTGGVFPVLSQAACLVHLNCNTSVEARLLDIAPLQVGHLNTARLKRHLPLYGGVSIETQGLDDLIALIREPGLAARRDRPESVFAQWIEPNLHLCDGRASERAARHILELTPTAARGPMLPLLARASRRRLAPRRALWAAAGTALGTAGAERLRAWHRKGRRDKAIPLDSVAGLAHRIARHSGERPPQAQRLRSPASGLPLAAIVLSKGASEE